MAGTTAREGSGGREDHRVPAPPFATALRPHTNPDLFSKLPPRFRRDDFKPRAPGEKRARAQWQPTKVPSERAACSKSPAGGGRSSPPPRERRRPRRQSRCTALMASGMKGRGGNLEALVPQQSSTVWSTVTMSPRRNMAAENKPSAITIQWRPSRITFRYSPWPYCRTPLACPQPLLSIGNLVCVPPSRERHGSLPLYLRSAYTAGPAAGPAHPARPLPRSLDSPFNPATAPTPPTTPLRYLGVFCYRRSQPRRAPPSTSLPQPFLPVDLKLLAGPLMCAELEIFLAHSSSSQGLSGCCRPLGRASGTRSRRRRAGTRRTRQKGGVLSVAEKTPRILGGIGVKGPFARIRAKRP